ncbi:MAG: transglycosylase SLT domain-containing protein [bacterium]
MQKPEATSWSKARRALERAMALYLDDSEVVLIDLGLRARPHAENNFASELVVRVHVQGHRHGAEGAKPSSQRSHHLVDSDRIGFVTQVLQADYRLDLWNETNVFPGQLRSSKTRNRGGEGLQTTGRRIGTVGGRVCDRKTGEELLLTTWHVFAALEPPHLSALFSLPSQRGDRDQTNVRVDFDRDAMHAHLDAAVFRVRDRTSLRHTPSHASTVTGVMIPQLGMRVFKASGTAGAAHGLVTGILGYAVQTYSGTRHVVGPFLQISSETHGQALSAPGDSGAWWVEKTSQRAVGLHVAGSPEANSALALSMPEVLEALSVDLVPGPQPQGELLQASSTAVAANALPVSTAAKLHSIMLRLSASFTARTREIKNGCSALQKMSPGARKFWSAMLAHCIRSREIFYTQIQSTLLLVRQWRAWSFFLLASPLIHWAVFVSSDRHLQNTVHRQAERIIRLDNDLRRLQATDVNHDAHQAEKLEKIIAIISRHNAQMPSDLKYKIVFTIYEMHRKYQNLDVDLICALITQESGWNPRALSSAGARGLMQIMPTTGSALAEEMGIPFNLPQDVLFDPIVNIQMGCRYLSRMLAVYGLEAGLAAYNCGEVRASRWAEDNYADNILPEETASYVPAILRLYHGYRRVKKM